MKSNKQKALELLKTSNWKINLDYAAELIELASKPDWYYPNKGEFPEDEAAVYCIIEISNQEDTTLAFYSKEGWYSSEFWDINFEVKAWTYLPKYQEDE